MKVRCNWRLPLQRWSVFGYRSWFPGGFFVFLLCLWAVSMATPEPSSSRNRLDQRVDKLETLFTHLEQTVKELDDVVIDGHQRIDSLSRQVKDLERRVARDLDTGDNEGDD